MTMIREGIAAHVQALEEILVEYATRKNRNAVSSLLADDFREFGSSGRVYNKQQILDELTIEAPCTRKLMAFECQLIATDVVLTTYRTTSSVASQASSVALRSSIWILREGRWQVLFHQGTKTTERE